MKESSYKLGMFVLLIIVTIGIGLRTLQREDLKAEGTYVVTKEKEEVIEELKKKQEPSVRADKKSIQALQNTSEDNIHLQKEELKIKWIGYEENPQAFTWINQQQWEQLQSQLEQYLVKKGMERVTEVHVHGDSIQTITPFERYLYLDVNHLGNGEQPLVIRAICDTYKEFMRFAFEIQYGD